MERPTDEQIRELHAYAAWAGEHWRSHMDIHALDEFTRAYIDCALWVGVYDENGSTDRQDEFESLHGSALREMIADCADFQAGYADKLTRATAIRNYNLTNAGHDFFLNRNGHGAGFWDRGPESIWYELSDACKLYGSAGLYVGDDDFLYHE